MSETPTDAEPPATIEALPKPAEAPAARRQDWTRVVLTLGFAGLFGLTVAASYFASRTDDWPQVKEWLLIILPVQTGLFGSVVGFYFGSRRDGR